jgi:hypothetical protein
VGLHYFHPEEVLSGIFIEVIVIVVSRDIEWGLFWVLKIVPPFHLIVALSDYDSCHPRHFRPKEGLKLREYCLQEAPLTIGTVKDPYCINLLCGRLVGHLELDL